MRKLITLLSAGLTIIALGCGAESQADGEAGSLSLELVVGGDIQVNEVEWEITNVDLDYQESGVIDVSSATGSASIEAFGLPPGEGYIMTMTALSADGAVSCGGSQDFGVEVGVVTEIMVWLNCERPTALGAVGATGRFNVCAQLTSVTVYPKAQAPGDPPIEVEAVAVDDDTDPIEYRWTASAGLFADPTAPSTNYVCDTAGGQLISIEVSDDGFDSCIKSWSVFVNCLP